MLHWDKTYVLERHYSSFNCSTQLVGGSMGPLKRKRTLHYDLGWDDSLQFWKTSDHIVVTIMFSCKVTSLCARKTMMGMGHGEQLCLWRVLMISCADYALKHALLELNGTCMVQIRTQHTYILTCAHNRLLRALNDRLTVCAVRPTITYVFGLQKPCNRNCKYLYHRSADWKWQWSVVHSCPNLYLLSQKSDMSCPVP